MQLHRHTTRSRSRAIAVIGLVIALLLTAPSHGVAAPGGTGQMAPQAILEHTGELTIAGEAVVGQKLSVDRKPTWPSGTRIYYQWLRDGRAISDASTTRYSIRKADIGAQLRVRVTARKSGYTPDVVESENTGPVLPETPKLLTAPRITGKLEVGRWLSVSKGYWKPTVSTVTYQWYRNDVAISGARSRSYRITTTDLGQTLRAEVTVKQSRFTAESATSASLGVPKYQPSLSVAVKRAAKKKAKITVKLPSQRFVEGDLTVRLGKKKLTRSVSANSGRKQTFTFKRLRAGKHKVRVSFVPTGQSQAQVTKASVLLRKPVVVKKS